MVVASHLLSLGPLLGWIPGMATWAVVWSILAAGTVVIIVLLRTRWSAVKAWKKCALLSLWVHVLLACLAAYVRIGTSGGPGSGPGEGGPIRVGVIIADAGQMMAVPELPVVTLPAPVSRDAVAERAAEEVAAAEPKIAAPPKDNPEPTPAPAAIVEKTTPAPASNIASAAVPPKPDASLAAPDLLAPPEPEPAVEPEPTVALEPTPAPDAEPPARAGGYQATDASVAESDSSPPTFSRDAEAERATASAGSPPSTAAATAGRPAVPSPYANRFGNRAALVAGGGGNPTTEKAVQSALAWLAASQSQDGHWDPKKFGAGQERYVLGENRGAAGARADTGITALALLAFMGAGNTHGQGPYADNIARGLDYLRRSQGANGNLGGDAEFFAHMYCHSMATFAVSEACALTGDPKLRPIVDRAVAYSLAAQNPAGGSWRYEKTQHDPGDTSQLGWQLMSLRSAQLAGAEIPAVTWTRVERFLRNVERGTNGGLAAYRPEGAPSRAMTAESLFCRQVITRRADGGLSPAAIDEARRALLEEPPGGVTVNLYYWYYATIALHRGQHHSGASDDAWREWNDALTRTLVKSQSSDGSWSTACIWGGYGGRVYTTSLAAMCLEVYYRYAPEDEEPAPAPLAHREDWQTVPTR